MLDGFGIARKSATRSFIEGPRRSDDDHVAMARDAQFDAHVVTSSARR
jgi:hypothetical protein